MKNNLSNKVILLTNGATGIGCECALAYAREDAVVGVVDQKTATEAGNNSFAIEADVSNRHAIELAVKALLDRFGRINAIHNNAGAVGPSRPLISDAAVFLLSDQSRFIAGRILPVSGGAEIGYNR